MSINKLFSFFRKKNSSSSPGEDFTDNNFDAPPPDISIENPRLGNYQSGLSTQRNKAYLKIALIIGAVAGICILLVSFSSPPKAPPPLKKPEMTLIEEDKLSQQGWIARSGQQMSKHKQELEAQRKELNQMRLLMEAMKNSQVGGQGPAGGPPLLGQAAQSQPQTPGPATGKFPPLPPPLPPSTQSTPAAELIGQHVAGAFSPPGGPPGGVMPPPAPPPGMSGMPPPPGVTAGGGVPPSPGVAAPVLPSVDGITVMRIKTPEEALAKKQAAVDAAMGRNPKDKKTDLRHMPAGSFFKAVLVSGMDAPSGTKGRGQPHPILLRIQDPAFLPNEFKYDVRGCFVLGEGHGSLSSERAYIRTTTVSCIKTDGESFFEAPMRGYITGEDGKIGLRGNVVSKNGALLSRSLMAGFLKGAGDAFGMASRNMTISPLTGVQTTTVDPSLALRTGVYRGISSSADILSKYYIDMANEIFPVIEIDAGRKVHVVLTTGQSIKFRSANP